MARTRIQLSSSSRKKSMRIASTLSLLSSFQYISQFSIRLAPITTTTVVDAFSLTQQQINSLPCNSATECSTTTTITTTTTTRRPRLSSSSALHVSALPSIFEIEETYEQPSPILSGKAVNVNVSLDLDHHHATVVLPVPTNNNNNNKNNNKKKVTTRKNNKTHQPPKTVLAKDTTIRVVEQQQTNSPGVTTTKVVRVVDRHNRRNTKTILRRPPPQRKSRPSPVRTAGVVTATKVPSTDTTTRVTPTPPASPASPVAQTKTKVSSTKNSKSSKNNRLTREEEITFTKAIKTLKAVIQIRDELAKTKSELAPSTNTSSSHQHQQQQQHQQRQRFEQADSQPHLPYKHGPSEEEWATACYNQNISDSNSIIQLRRILIAGREARSKLVAGNVGLVVQVARRYFHELRRSVEGGGANGIGSILTLQDLIQEGNLGLMEAAERYDAGKGARFGTYAQYWVRQRILRSMADNSRVIRLPVHVHSTLRNIRKTKADMEKEIGREPSLPELAHRLEMSPEKVQLYTDSSRTVLSLEVPLSSSKSTKAGSGEGDKRTLGERIPSDSPTPIEDAESHALRQDIKEAIDGLGNERERDVLVLRFGLDDGTPKTFDEIASRMSISRDRVRMLEARALNKLRHPQRNYRLKEYVDEQHDTHHHHHHQHDREEMNGFHNSIYGFGGPSQSSSSSSPYSSSSSSSSSSPLPPGKDTLSSFSPEQIWSF